MKRLLSKLLLVALMLNLALPVSVIAAPRFNYSRFTVAQSWVNGKDEYWHIVPVGEKTEFRLGEKVQFFAQIGPVDYAHQWRLVLYRDGRQYKVQNNPKFSPGQYNGWNYSNFVPFMTNLPIGEYRANYQLDSGSGFETLASVNFRVVNDNSSSGGYVLAKAVVASGWRYGSSDYWNIEATGQKTTFNQGETVYLVSQLKNITVDHRYKLELYRTDGRRNRVFENVTPWNRVGQGWTYSNYQPYYSNAEIGNYQFRLSIDTGSGWTSLATKTFRVVSQRDNPRRPYYYDRTTVSRGWQNGSGSEYWNVRPVDPRNSFNYGDDVFAVSVVRNIIEDYQWKAELYRNGQLVWQDATPWRNVGMGHAYGSYYPEYHNALPGSYEWRIYLNTGTGWQLLDTKNFTVSDNWGGPTCNSGNNYCNYDCRYYGSCFTDAKWTYNGATVAENWKPYGNDQRNLQPVNPRTNFSRGATVYVVAQARDVRIDHRWSVEAYRNNALLWTFKTPWNRVNNTTWPYSSVVTSNYNSDYGNYEFRIFFDDGSGFRQVDSKYFYVNY